MPCQEKLLSVRHVNLNYVTRRPKAGTVKSEEPFIARQLLGKHILEATNTQAITE
jgi:hypothetical protein